MAVQMQHRSFRPVITGRRPPADPLRSGYNNSQTTSASPRGGCGARWLIGRRGPTSIDLYDPKLVSEIDLLIYCTAYQHYCTCVKRVVLLKRSCTKPMSLGTTVFVECFPVAGEKALSHYNIIVSSCVYRILSMNVGFYFGIKC